MVAPLLGQISIIIVSVTADGAHDGESVYHAIAQHQPHMPPTVIIPSRATAVLSSTTNIAPSLRDRYIQLIQEKGRRD